MSAVRCRIRTCMSGGPSTTATISYARTEVSRTARSETPVHHLKTKIAEYGHNGRPPLCVAQVNLDIEGRLVRRQSAGPTVVLAVDRVIADLPPVLRQVNKHLTRPAGPPSFAGHQWRHRREPRPVPPYARPSGQPRRLARHKAFTLAVQNAAAAALTMDLRDYDFYLYRDDGDGLDRVIYRAPPTGYRIAVLPGAYGSDLDPDLPVRLDSSPMPSLSVPEAVRLLDSTKRAFLVFASAAARASILYRRYDGHLGLVTPRW
jgi:hypothetical protein